MTLENRHRQTHNVTIRQGTPEDIPDLLQLISALADYERALNEVEITEEQLLQDGFGSKQMFRFLVAIRTGKCVGIALYYDKYSTWKGRCIYLEDIVVSHEFRNNGIGTALFSAIVDIAQAEKVKRLEWQVLDWNAAAIKFYEKFGTEISNEWLNGRLYFESGNEQ